MQLSLIVADGQHAGQKIRVKGSKFTIGRSPECDLRAKSRQVSRQHCVIKIGEDRVTIRDLGSRNGTLVNGEKIESEYELKSGDHLTVGRFELEAKITDNTKAKAESSQQSVVESEAPPETSVDPAGISGIALSIMESIVEPSDDNFELTGRSGASNDWNANESTQSFTWPKDEEGSDKSETAESDEDPESEKSHDPSEYVVTEAEKEAARTNRGIVGVSKSAQAKRVTGTSQEAAAEALRRFRR